MTDAAENPPPAPAAPPATPPPPRHNRERIVVVALLAGLAALAISRGAIDRESIILISVIVPSIILHEVSHGAVANFFGDDTAKRAGRLTLNPLAHVDPMGTIVMPTILALSHLSPFGFAKPVPVNVSRLRHPRNNGLLVSLAGPGTNYALALVAAGLFRVLKPGHVEGLGGFRVVHLSTLGEVILAAGVLNVFLGTFNLLPVPPLDGSALVERLLPDRYWPGYLRFRRYSMFLVLIVVFWFHGALDFIYEPVSRLWVHLAGPLPLR
jgi:Zn-dependent protease